MSKITPRLPRSDEYFHTVFERDGKHVGHMHMTYHPTIPYQVYTADSKHAKRVNNISEAIGWLETMLD